MPLENQENKEPKKLSYEVYTIILKHCIWDGESEQEHQIEEPLIIKQMSCLGYGYSQCMLNEMMDKMKHELLRRSEKYE